MDLWTTFISILVVIVGAAISGVISLIIYARWYRGTLEKVGIPVIKPHWFLGSNFDGHLQTSQLMDLERARKYGPIYGVYDGRQPVVFISDPKIIKIIQMRDFEHFRNHRKLFSEHPILTEVLDFLDDDKWKTIRSTLTPHFTTGRIRQMCETISDISLEYVTALKMEMGSGKNEQKMEFRQYVPPLILEIIGKLFCGIHLENARDPHNVFVRNMKLCMGGDFVSMDWTYTYSTAVPFVTKFFPVFPPGAMEMFGKTITEILNGRQKVNVSQDDMVNTLIEIGKRAETDPNYKSLGITKNTALGQAFEFFFASYEGIRSVLTFFIYNLATYTEVQEKVREETDTVLAKQGNKKINWETVSEMPYMTACLTETFRMQPSFFRLDRVCTKDWEYDGIKIKKNTEVTFPLWAIQRDPAVYEDPDDFNPERFMPGKKEQLDPFAFGVFGGGPRACIGQRFSFEMLKIIMVHYIKEFTIEKRADTELTYVKANPLFLSTEPIYVNFVKRNLIQ